MHTAKAQLQPSKGNLSEMPQQSGGRKAKLSISGDSSVGCQPVQAAVDSRVVLEQMSALVPTTPCEEGLTCRSPGMGMSVPEPTARDQCQAFHRSTRILACPALTKKNCYSSTLHRTGTALVVSAEARKPKKKFLRVLKGWGNFSLIQLEFSKFHRPPASVSGEDE